MLQREVEEGLVHRRRYPLDPCEEGRLVAVGADDDRRLRIVVALGEKRRGRVGQGDAVHSRSVKEHRVVQGGDVVATQALQAGQARAVGQRQDGTVPGPDSAMLCAPTSYVPLSDIARAYKSNDAGCARWLRMLLPPADSPKMVTAWPSPPNASMWRCTQVIARRWSAMPKFPEPSPFVLAAISCPPRKPCNSVLQCEKATMQREICTHTAMHARRC